MTSKSIRLVQKEKGSFQSRNNNTGVGHDDGNNWICRTQYNLI